MKIGIDLDGCLADFNTGFRQRCIDVTGVNHFDDLPNGQPYFPLVWDWPAAVGYTSEQVTSIWASVRADRSFWYTLSPYPDTVTLLARLRDRIALGDEVYFVTDRKGIDAKLQTEAWLNSYGLPKPTVLLSPHKGLVARALQFNRYLDDKWENALSVACIDNWGTYRCQSYLLDRPWNRGYNTYVHRIFSPLDVLAEI